MSNKLQEIDKKNRTLYLFDDMINIKYDSKKIKKYEKSYRNILIYYTGYLTVEILCYATTNSVKPL